MAITTQIRQPTKKMHQDQNQKPKKSEKPPSWVVVRSILTCKHIQIIQQQQQQQKQEQQQKKKQKQKEQEQTSEESNKKCKKMKCSGSLCSTSTTKVMQRPETSSSSPEDHHNKKRASSMGSSNYNNGSSRSIKAPLQEVLNGVVVSSPSSSSFSSSFNSSSLVNNNGGSFRGMPFRKFSGCYECRMVVDPILGMTRDPSLRASICSCPDCGEIFMKAENLELHQAVRHAVSELGPDDTSKNIVEIIFQSSWLKKQTPVCKIDRILKVHNTQKTISNFESYRDAIKAKATKLPKKHPRCIADGNELLRFHSTTFVCSLGLNGSSNLCNSIPNCNVCSIIKNGFKVTGKGILTTATSGKAHDSADLSAAEGGGGPCGGDEKRAMLVCRVIAGRVKKSLEGSSVDEFDSVGGAVGVFSNLDELYVCNPNAILPCFVVIYGGF